MSAFMGETYVEDTLPKNETLAEHDKKKHPDGFDPKTDTCKFREKIASETETDKVDEVSSDRGGQTNPSNNDTEPKEGGISRIFTGSAASYDKPSLLQVGTGEGSQVYGWGLYGSTVRGVAEGYANPGGRISEVLVNGERHKAVGVYEVVASMLKNGDAKEFIKDTLGALDEMQYALDESGKSSTTYGIRTIDQKYIDKRRAEIKEAQRIINEGATLAKPGNVYEQTFFTDRASDDESHLLRWYEPSGNVKDQLGWIREQAKREGFLDEPDKYGNTLSQFLNTAEKTLIGRNGQDIYSAIEGRLGSPKAASEFLARAGIDGVKYPVDSYGGKTVKDGDVAGWNYVSFRDDNIRIDKKYVDGQKMYDYEELMAKHHSNLDPMEVLSHLTRLDAPEEMAAEFARIMESGKIEKDKTVQDELVEALVEDADTLKDQTLQEHDRIHHPNGYHQGDTCKFRDKLATETDTDQADVENPNAAPGEGTKEEDNSELTPEDKEFNRLVAEREALVRRNNEIPEENKKDSERAQNKEITWEDFFALRKERASEAEQNQKKFNKLDKRIEKMFRQAAGKAMPNTKVVGKDGLPMIVYHGTVRPRKDGFTEFADRPIFAFKQEGLASQYTHSRRDMWVSPDRTGHVIPMVMNLENPYVVDAGKRLWSNIAVDWSNEPVDTDAICKYAKEHGHDGVIIRQVRDNMFDNDRSAGDEYIAFSSNQVKDCGGIYETKEGKGLSHDYEVLVSDVGNTKDDNGNVIPLSRRFDDGDDIRGDVSGRTEYIEKMKSLHPDINPNELINRLKGLGSREEMEAEIAKILGKE